MRFSLAFRAALLAGLTLSPLYIAPACCSHVESESEVALCVLTYPPGHCEVSYSDLVSACLSATGRDWPALDPAQGACDCAPLSTPLRCEDGNVYHVTCCMGP